LFDKLVSPILNNACDVWGFVKGDAIERVHLQFCKRLLGVKKTTQNDFIYGELGRVSYQTLKDYNIIKFWINILNTENNKFIRKTYDTLRLDMERYPQKQNWCSLLKELLSRLGVYEAWHFQAVENDKLFFSLVKQRLTDQFVQDWSARLESSSRAIFYWSICDFKLQSYLKVLTISKFRYSIAQLRVSSHRLQVEEGRWKKPNPTPFNERKCISCNKLEHEYYFVLECNFNDELRNQHIPHYYRNRPTIQTFVQLLNSENESLIKKISVYTYMAFKIRNAFHYA